MTERTGEKAPAAGCVLIRTAEAEDVPGIAALEKECFSDAWSAHAVEGTRDSRTGYLLVAEETSGETPRMLGYLIARTVDDEGELLRIAAAEEARGCGIGGRLLARMLEDHPSVALWRLDVRTQNAAAIALYRKNGFRIVTESPDVYRDPKDNGYLMIRGMTE